MHHAGTYEPITLSETLFPTAPFKCGAYWCFQYQVQGKYDLSEVPPIRSMHLDQGIFAGSFPRFETIRRTYEVKPIGVKNNLEIDPHLHDWFSENKVPLKRSFEWQFRTSGEMECGLREESWEGFTERLITDHTWVENKYQSCLAIRPKRSDAEGSEILVRLSPSAETIWEKQKYDVPTLKAKTVYGVLMDMEIPNESRCTQIKSWLEKQLGSAVTKNSLTQKFLGIYTPLSITDRMPLSGCEQRSLEDYPISEMVKDARAETAKAESPIRIVWIYINNINQPPPTRVLLQIATLRKALSREMEIYLLTIGSDFILNAVSSNRIEFPEEFEKPDEIEDIFQDGIGWRPIEDQTFAADIRAWAKATLPFKTMEHDKRTEIPIQKPADTDPEFFKICQSTPFEFRAIGIETGKFRYSFIDGSVPWPEENQPFFTVNIVPQFLLPNNRYTQHRLDHVIEVCERFCLNPFQTQNGDIYRSWKIPRSMRPMEVCQWTEK